jgi:hypothetical protein
MNFSRIVAKASLALSSCFGTDVDFAQLTKMFGDYGQCDSPEARYSPPRISGVISKVRQGDPDPEHVSTSFVERQNLTMRMQLRRFTRLTNAFSKKLSHLKAAVSLHFAYYNFCRIHSSLAKSLPRWKQELQIGSGGNFRYNSAVSETGELLNLCNQWFDKPSNFCVPSICLHFPPL